MALGLLTWTHMSGADTWRTPIGSLCREWLSAKMALGVILWTRMSGPDTWRSPIGSLCREWLSPKMRHVATAVHVGCPLATFFYQVLLFGSRQTVCRVPVSRQIPACLRGVPVFIAEIAPKDLRGGLATSNQLLIVCGSSTTYITGALVTWRNLVLVGIVPSVLLLVGLLFIPESPRWLAQVGREEEFHTALQMLRGENADISEEAIEIKEYIESLQSLPKARIQDLFLSRNIFAVIVGVGLMIFQQLGGINGVGFYASSIFSSAGFSGKLGTILIGIVQIPITLLGAFLMDRSGRRVLLMVSASGTFLGCFLTGISFYLKAHGLFLEWVPALALSGILVYIGAYSIGMGPVPWVVMSEIFAINIKAIGGSLVTLISWLGSFAVSYSFNFLMDWSSAGTFFMFSAASLVTILFVARLVPETKGKTLEEIQDAWN
ncbi:Sugar transporter ERD6-like 16 [Triticum urartu]|uniref:Sugar transporter ERD6-like 16 n=1 Tax=Triticum urartu TaxID=4572 RepID=M7ZM83_TRIUA|nr:Sugar transporter ERD6-like 16 [Triticum urartu]